MARKSKQHDTEIEDILSSIRQIMSATDQPAPKAKVKARPAAKPPTKPKPAPVVKKIIEKKVKHKTPKTKKGKDEVY